MKQIVVTRELVSDYYRGAFARDLQNYFTIEGPTLYRGHSMVQFMDRIKGVPSHPAFFSPTEHQFIFSGLVLHMILAAQAINAVCGKDHLWDSDLVKDFYQASGWPEFSAGLGGPYADVGVMLQESHLYPESFEVSNYARMLEIVAPFMREEIRKFLTGEEPQNLDSKAYARLKQNAKGRVGEIVQWMAARAEELLVLPS